MNTFVNGFHIAKKNDNSEVVVYLTQVSPSFAGLEDSETNDHREIVGRFVMRPECARELSQKLAIILGAADPFSEASPGGTQEDA